MPQNHQRTGHRADSNKSSQRNAAGCIRCHIHSLEVLSLHAVLCIGLNIHLPGSAKTIEIVDVQRTKIHLQSTEDFGHGQSKLFGRFAINIQFEPGCVSSEPRKQVSQFRRLHAV